MNTSMADPQKTVLACPICRSARITYTRLNKSRHLVEFTCSDCAVVWEKSLEHKLDSFNELAGLTVKRKQGDKE
jgi:transcription elongation factor Elf1